MKSQPFRRASLFCYILATALVLGATLLPVQQMELSNRIMLSGFLFGFLLLIVLFGYGFHVVAVSLRPEENHAVLPGPQEPQPVRNSPLGPVLREGDGPDEGDDVAG
jgi:hypothetical protein